MQNIFPSATWNIFPHFLPRTITSWLLLLSRLLFRSFDSLLFCASMEMPQDFTFSFFPFCFRWFAFIVMCARREMKSVNKMKWFFMKNEEKKTVARAVNFQINKSKHLRKKYEKNVRRRIKSSHKDPLFGIKTSSFFHFSSDTSFRVSFLSFSIVFMCVCWSYYFKHFIFHAFTFEEFIWAPGKTFRSDSVCSKYSFDLWMDTLNWLMYARYEIVANRRNKRTQGLFRVSFCDYQRLYSRKSHFHFSWSQTTNSMMRKENPKKSLQINLFCVVCLFILDTKYLSLR